MQIYDVCIIGAGPVGLSLAAALQKSKQLNKVLILDSIKKPKFNKQGLPNQRVLSVTQSSREVLQSVGAWDKLEQGRVNPYNRMIIDESNGQDYLEFKNQQAHIIEYDNIVNALLEVYDGEIEFESKLEKIELKPNEYVTVNDKFQCKLLIGSDGNKSKVKECSNIGTYGHSYHQMGIVCTVERTDQDSEVAYQTYLSNGCPLALLPLYNPYSSIVWTAYMDDYKYLMSLSDEEFLKVLNSQLGRYAPRIKSISNKRMAFPLQSLQAQRYIQKRIALIGDAAHSNHPMAGQGMNMGINDAALLANCIIKNSRSGNDIGLEQSLEEYESQAKLMNYTTSIAMELIKNTYENKTISPLRQLGAKIINNLDPIKQIMIQYGSKHPLGPSQFEWVK
ncbi:unnamed protein product (macronuclear) [Paramecium tetraurelia]|uniref:Chromosome undetermined scaffold_1, whole genome shotgun sequence n=1 Tax=Paramecium tetraurelia TaxID=5888 RepID=Q6BFP7_PARTE|nr:Ubiquinone monooxygenase [Paramecium tetraurelia strain d4-2]XP_001423134.1 uncharacterized protein GSPATT00000171001 [Paramecium tetraurelia]CAH03523.1 Ubiquinone monooxygenase, putative [Paramecium tetraurelia]CAK55736.1 unnamed protein product [Paramecium tetraurelia]|eukprot:XP_001423134.1 hypothetical protein (macronuclear) [Paramecium tetraurelia strain d4-2]